MTKNDAVLKVLGLLLTQGDGQPKDSLDDEYIGKYVLCRSDRGGVFAGTVVNRNGQEVKLQNARRIWYWDGAASLSELAVSGTSRPENCKFPVEVSSVIMSGVIEIIPCTEVSKNSIKGVKVWTQ